MKEEKNEFLGLLCNLYLVALLVILPLYTGEGYWNLGDTKYLLFRNLSLICLGCWLVFGMPGRLKALAGIVCGWRRTLPGESSERAGVLAGRVCGRTFRMVDWAVLAYGVCVVFSALFSSYGVLAWTGYREWYMGAFSQLLFVGIYFFVSRQYDGAVWPLGLGTAALFLVTLLGLLHRLGIDPLGLQTGWNSGDWVYNHMLSTLGNINWLCGYYSVALAFVLLPFMREKVRWLQGLLYVVATLAFVLLGVQGSMGGLLILAVAVGVCIWQGYAQAAVMRKLFGLLALFFLCMPLMGLLMDLRGDLAAVAADGNVFEHTVWYGWGLAAGVSLGFFFLFGQETFFQRWKRLCESRRTVVVLMFGAVVGIALTGYFLIRGMNDSFGSGRGFLWRLAWEGFVQAGWKDRLIGAGPDCYAEAVFLKLGVGTDVWQGEHWEGSIFTNAHNELLSQLINVGILGMASYLAIFVTGLRRYCSSSRSEGVRWLGALVLLMYGAHSLVSFQQVLNAPLFFLALGLCESGSRRQELVRKSWSGELMKEQDNEMDEV